MTDRPVVIVGAGLAGLCCARELHSAGVPFVLLDALSRVGGRVATDRVDGFLLDRGFQVLLTGYPEARRQLDYDALDLKSFRPGCLVRTHDRVTRLGDPWREPVTGAMSLFSPLLSLRDAVRMAGLRRGLVREDGDRTGSAADVLERAGISPALRRAFFEPFFGGVTLDRSLSVPGDYFAFLFRMFAVGGAALPARGMAAIPEQLAAGLPAESVRLDCPVRSIDGDVVTIDGAAPIHASSVVVATDGVSAHRLAGTPEPENWNGTTTVYFAAERAPIDDGTLMLDGTGDGPALHVSVPSNVQHSYAPFGAALVSASVLGVGAPSIEEAVRTQLMTWFGGAVTSWRHLATYRIPHAQPRLPTAEPAMERSGVEVVRDGLIVCGDHLATPSIQGAMLAGRNAARAITRATAVP